MNMPHILQMFLERIKERLWENCAMIAIALRIPNDDLMMTEIEIFYTQTYALIQAETTSVEELEDQSVSS